jgi:hypothetical protein
LHTTTYTIENDGSKGRAFSGLLAAKLTTPVFLDTSSSTVSRPCFAMFVGSLNELRPFIANLMLGKKAVASGYRNTKIEFLKSTKYQVIWQIESEPKGQKYSPEPMSIATVYYPEAFLLDPGMVDPERISFCTLPTKAWVESQKVDFDGPVRHMEDHFLDVGKNFKSWVVHSYLFAAMLDRRTRCPLPMDGRFYLQLLYSCCRAGMLRVEGHNNYDLGGSFRYNMVETTGLSEVGLDQAMVFHAGHEQFEALLSEEVTKFYSVVG